MDLVYFSNLLLRRLRALWTKSIFRANPRNPPARKIQAYARQVAGLRIEAKEQTLLQRVRVCGLSVFFRTNPRSPPACEIRAYARQVLGLRIEAKEQTLLRRVRVCGLSLFFKLTLGAVSTHHNAPL